MKKLIIAAGLLAIGATTAAAQYGGPPRERWSRDAYPYAERRHSSCQEKARRLHNFERRAASDGRVNFRERQIVRDLQRDLDRTCGRFRWRG